MAAKPKLWYFHGRGRMESIRWLLAAAGVEVGSRLGNGRTVIRVRLKWSSSPFKSQDGSFQAVSTLSLSNCLPEEGGLIVLCLNRGRKGEA